MTFLAQNNIETCMGLASLFPQTPYTFPEIQFRTQLAEMRGNRVFLDHRGNPV